MIALVVAAIAGAGLTGCSTATSKKKLLERIQPPQPVLAGTAVYGGGALTVESWLGSSVRLKKTDGNAGAGEGRERSGQRRPESEANRDPGEADNPFAAGDKDYTPQEIDDLYGRVNYEYAVPPRLTLTFKFTNSGAQPITFTIADVNSSLGNFAPRPETLTVKPGQAGTVDPMLSNLDTNFEELDVTLTLKIGGNKETHLLKLLRAQEAAVAPHQN